MSEPPPKRNKFKIARPDSYCLACGKRMSPGRSGRRRYCNTACKQRAYRSRVTVTNGSSNG